MEKKFALTYYRLLFKSLPKENRNLNKHLYKNMLPSNSGIETEQIFLKDLKIYLDISKEYNKLLEIYNIAIPRDMKNQIKHVSRMVGFDLPELFEKRI